MRAAGMAMLGGIVAACALACGGATFAGGGGPGDSGPGDGGPSDGAPSDAGSSPCPTGVPDEASPCSPVGLRCEYGSSPIESCDTVATCQQGGWSLPAPLPPPEYCGSGASPPCPSSFGGVPRRTHCSPYGTTCDYPQGRCACAVPAGPGFPVDASAAAEWLCQDPTSSRCPVPRPRLGTACSTEALQCDYGTCDIPGGNSETCTGGVWTPGGSACPAAAAGP